MIKGAIIIFYKILGEEAKFLIVENKQTGNWTFVGGACENDETEMQTAQREIKEEIGLIPEQYNLVETDLHHDFVFNERKKDRAGEQGSYQVFLADLTDYFGEVKAEKKVISKVEWLIEEQIQKKLTFPEHKEIFQKVINF